MSTVFIKLFQASVRRVFPPYQTLQPPNPMKYQKPSLTLIPRSFFIGNLVSSVSAGPGNPGQPRPALKGRHPQRALPKVISFRSHYYSHEPKRLEFVFLRRIEASGGLELVFIERADKSGSKARRS